MAEEPLKVGDFLGIKEVGKAINKLTEGLVDGTAAFLSPICLPAAEELGLLFKERVSYWRASQLASIAEKAKRKMIQNPLPPNAHAHPRIVHAIIEHGSLTDDAQLQDMWAGLLASSCTPEGDDDSNLIFTNLLSGLTRLQARVLKYGCEASSKDFGHSGLIMASELRVTFAQLCEIAGEKDVQRLDRELDYLRSVSLLMEYTGGFDVMDSSTANIAPSALALHMYVRCQGSRDAPIDFFKLTQPATPADAEKEK
jgi:hypothetical protein